MNQLLVIFTYGGADEILHRHLRFFDRAECDLLVSSPEDDPSLGWTQQFICGQAQKYGGKLIDRILKTYAHCLSLNYDAYLFTEYDSVVTKKLADHPRAGLQTFIWNDRDPQWLSPFYFHHPHWYDHALLQQVVSLAPSLPPDAEQGFIDRWLGALFLQHNLPYAHRPDFCYSRNTLDCPQYLHEARQAIRHGATVIHGIKTLEHLKELGL